MVAILLQIENDELLSFCLQFSLKFSWLQVTWGEGPEECVGSTAWHAGRNSSSSFNY